MDNKRYDYSPIIRRPTIEWHNHGRIALWVAPNIEYFHYNMAIRGTGSKKEKMERKNVSGTFSTSKWKMLHSKWSVITD